MKSRYLAEGAVFPTEAGAELWGPETLGLDIAGQAIRAGGLSTSQRRTLEALWPEFARPVAGDAVIELSVFRVAPSRFRQIETRGWSYALDFDYGSHEMRLAGIDLLGRIEWKENLSSSLWVAAEDPETFRGAFENFLRVLLAQTLLVRGGVLLHSAAIVDDGRARLFFGHSGAGKSTVARMALGSGLSVLSDDLNLVVPGPEGFLVAGSPFLGDVGSRRSGSYPLAGLYRLSKGSHDSLRPLGRAESFASLLSCSSFVNHSPHAGARLSSNLESIARAVPGFVLTFRREGNFWPLLEPCPA